MATTLASQLAQIRVQSTNALDLKAQKKAHSKSLLFDARHAATQDFETLFQICSEGFRELCRLDQRFLAFAGNLFSDQSRQEDRTQMTAAQNKSLDSVLEDFMALVGGRLMLKPAMKAMEWLIRRFSVHKFNMTCFVLTFLPYHTSSMFSTVLAILPERRPAAFKFLQPYLQSSTNPPRHTIVHTLAHNQDLFSVFNNYTLNVCRREQQYPALVSFWSSMTTEAVALILDRSRLGRLELQKKNQEDVVMRLMPFLAEGLAMQHVPDLRVGCYMILTVLCSKTNLSEAVLTSTMDLVVYEWDGITHAGLICLVMLSQQRQAVTLPKKTFKALIAIEQLSADLMLLKTQYRVGKLVLGLILGSIQRLGRSGDAERLRYIRVLLEANLMQPSFVAIALTPMLHLSQDIDSLSHPKGGFATRSALTDLLLYLFDSEAVGSVVHSSLDGMDTDARHIAREIFGQHRSLKERLEPHENDDEMSDADRRVNSARFDDLVCRIPSQTAFEMSLLSHSNSYILSSLTDTFLAAYHSPENLVAFAGLPILRKSLATVEPLYFSFFVRIWCGSYSASARAAAIRMVTDYVATEKHSVDIQMLLPYIVYALADPSSLVRRAATELTLALASFFSTVGERDSNLSKLKVLGEEQIYGPGKKSEEVAWLTWPNAVEFVQDWLVPGMEEFKLDSEQILRSLVYHLNAPAETKVAGINGQKSDIPLRSSVLNWLCSHVISTPLYSFKAKLLPVLISIPKVGQISTATLLKPLLIETVTQGYEAFQKISETENIDTSRYLNNVMEIATAKDKDSVKLLQNCISAPQAVAGPSLHLAAFRRLRQLWPLLKSQSQVSVGKFMLDLAVSKTSTEEASIKQTEALITLRTVKLSTDTLQTLLEDCPSLAHDGSQKAAKRRRTASSPKATEDDVKKISVVLEIVEASATEANLPLVGRLFKVLADLQGYEEHSGLELLYLELLTMNSILSILQHPTNLQIEKSDVRADVLVECVRNSSNPQVQQSALLVVSVLASILPDLIIHSVMPIFTFMNSSIMKRTDDYSAHVVMQTMDSVVPRVMESLRKRHKDSLAGVSELLLSFAAAFEHVPPPRRLGLFQSLMDMIGADEFLFALLILLKNKFPRNKRALQFCIDLLDCYGAPTQIQTIDRYVATILDSTKPKPTFSTHLVDLKPSHNSEETAMILLDHLTALLGAGRHVPKISQTLAQENDQSDSLRSLLPRVMDQILSLSRQHPENEGSGLPMTDFIATIQGLLESVDVQTSFDALRSFELRLSSRKPIPVAGQDTCFGFLPKLTKTIETSDHEPTKRVALACVGHIVEQFGKKNVDAVIGATSTVMGTECLGTSSEEMYITSLLSLATIVEVLGDDFVQFVPHTLPLSLNILNSKLDNSTCSKRVHNAGFSFFSALLLYMPWAIAEPDLDLLLMVSHGSANAELGEECSAERRATLGTWANAMAEGPEALKEHLCVLETLIGRLSKSAVGRQSEAFAALLTKAFDLRRIQLGNRTEDSYDDKEIDDMEEVTNRVAIAMIYKSNDTIFRPMFVQLIKWAGDSSPNAMVHRKTTLYGFFIRFFDTLKSIVTSYAGLILEDAVEILGKVDFSDPASKLLWTKVIESLRKCFTHDQDGRFLPPGHLLEAQADNMSGFWQSPTHFTPISQVLLDQLKRAAEVSMAAEVIPSVTELAVAADSPNHHKVLNATILKYTRSDDPAVRLAAVQCQQSLTNRLGEEWLALLPEMLPFVSELQEDDDETVERETLRWIKKIEDVLGESLTPMLQ
ncbi:MAG: hypothetical protein L6R40_000903 [Gallowayella cf. fulva]|nr:MAG: hypothetical protein L6R40_000903 [Xanthomendoza cf. fulva]